MSMSLIHTYAMRTQIMRTRVVRAQTSSSRLVSAPRIDQSAPSVGKCCSRRRAVLCLAKKKAGKKGNKSKKNESKFSMLTKEKQEMKPAIPHESAEVVMNLLFLIESYTAKLGKPLVQGGLEITSIAQAIWEAPFVLLFHQLNGDRPPTFCYANRAALNLFETSWDEFVGMESSRTAEEDKEIQSERDDYLAKAMEKGFVEGLEAWRISQKGTKFLIKDATLWNIARGEEVMGQAAVFSEWEYEDGSEGTVAIFENQSSSTEIEIEGEQDVHE